MPDNAPVEIPTTIPPQDETEEEPVVDEPETVEPETIEPVTEEEPDEAETTDSIIVEFEDAEVPLAASPSDSNPHTGVAAPAASMIGTGITALIAAFTRKRRG